MAGARREWREDDELSPQQRIRKAKEERAAEEFLAFQEAPLLSFDLSSEGHGVERGRQEEGAGTAADGSAWHLGPLQQRAETQAPCLSELSGL